MLPSILARQLQKGLEDYIETTFPMANEPFRGSLHKMLQTKGSVYHEPYVSVRLPFRVADAMPTCFEAVHPTYLPYVHQQNAFNRLTGEEGKSTLIATGTGSGKTECFLYPILEYCFQHRGENGIKALIIYPMNALATDQAKRIAELIYNSPELRGNVTAGMYVGGQDQISSRLMDEANIVTDHETMLNQPPDILLTNYKMLDYLLVRPKDAALWKENTPETLKYIVVDELHTFDGAQGTDLACLLRRLKSRLWTPNDFICCVGTSATMGSKKNSVNIMTYASEIFGEPFENDALITEDRLTPEEFFDGKDITDFTMPTSDQVEELNKLIDQDNEIAYLKLAAKAWIASLNDDFTTDQDRIALGDRLMHHSFFNSVISLTSGNYYQVSHIIEELRVNYPDLEKLSDSISAVNALFALISFARTGSIGQIRPFLNVQVQLWIRELRRLVAKVSPRNVIYSIAHDLNSQQSKQYLPVVNCRDCGVTGWVSILNERMNATILNLEAFYNRYFEADDKVIMLFPNSHDNTPNGTSKARFCPDCLHVKFGESSNYSCDNCGSDTMEVIIPTPNLITGSQNTKQFICPYCGSKRGLSLMGLRSATEISASLSQLFASKFNDDKKTLAFSDNVQDAAHRAGFFNSRTWKFGLRSAIQKYVQNGGAGQNLQDFTENFLQYWHDNLSEEDFISLFIAPNMTWMHAYEEMVKNRKLSKDQKADKLMQDVEKRLSYEIMLEYGLTARIGRTLEKSTCSIIAFNKAEVKLVSVAVYERMKNEVCTFTETTLENFEQMVIGYLTILRQKGAFDDHAFSLYIRENGNAYLLSNDQVSWMPGRQSGRNTPRFIAQQQNGGRRNTNFDSISDRKYIDWIASCYKETLIESGVFAFISQFILEELTKRNLVTTIYSTLERKVFGLNKRKVYISEKVVQMKCKSCGTSYFVAEENLDFWQNAPCARSVCYGIIEQVEDTSLNYYGKLFSSGDHTRINAREHTGLLERHERESIEVNFKRKKDTSQMWDPNVLSCTPTLEMGIDIGDLSTVILCSIPPAQSQFLQRTGRAGRKDGNSLTLAVANARSHDLYFYSDPLDMIEGTVVPPKIFLKASAVLERQFVAFCMDSWVKSGVSEQAIPKIVGVCLSKLVSHPVDVFPFNFLSYVQNDLTHLLNSFIRLFSQYLDENAKSDLQFFTKGNKLEESPMHIRILESFHALKRQRDSLLASIKQLKTMVKELENKPQDISYDNEIKDLKSEQLALLNVIRELNRKDVFNFLSDEGLLPNYAFPESGVILKAVLYRTEEKITDENITTKRKYNKSVYEYSRASSSAITDFAPNNSFYVDGRKLIIDQIDLTSAQTAKWRLCPNCAHAEIDIAGRNVASCPQCGSPSWADIGQVRTLLKIQMVYSNMEDRKSRIGDESDDRSNVFYCKQLLVDVDEDHDVSSAYQMDNEEFAFGYEFVKKATLREINFGESDVTGEKMFVSGVEEVRKGFKICKYCGKIQPNNGSPTHTFYCKARRIVEINNDAYEECLFLYREFTTEILRILIPATTMDSSSIRTESFTAAFMLGMKEYFGNVDHLRATVSEVPVPEVSYRKQYLVIYDSVPGGTGYLKQLMQQEYSLVEIFEKALEVLEQCSCKDDPQKDGCYHCLFAYRQSQNIGSISRSAAIRILRAILAGKENKTKIGKLGNIPVNSLFESELERRFIEAIAQMGNESRKIEISKALIHEKEGYVLKVNESIWEIEPQVLLDTKDGVAITCKPDFLISPIGVSSRLPVAIFTDGFIYHKDKVSDDTIKREAIRRSGKYRVWSLSWRDVQSVFQAQGDYFTQTLAAEKMPSGHRMYQQIVNEASANLIKPDKMSVFELLMRYLDITNAEEIFATHAKAYSLSLLDPSQTNNPSSFQDWNSTFLKVIEETHFSDDEFEQSKTFFGKWIPRSINTHLSIFAGILFSDMRLSQKAPVSVCAVLDDRIDTRTDKFEQEWNGFWQFFNIMQFAERFIAVCTVGLEQMAYTIFPIGRLSSEIIVETSVATNEVWQSIKDLLFDDSAKRMATKLQEMGVSAPNEVGLEIIDNKGEVIATIEFAWTTQKIGFLTDEQYKDKEKLEANGWKVLNASDVIEIELFGGEN
jgi:DEAD/DEAH box helicase domain-containing protein